MTEEIIKSSGRGEKECVGINSDIEAYKDHRWYDRVEAYNEAATMDQALIVMNIMTHQNNKLKENRTC